MSRSRKAHSEEWALLLFVRAAGQSRSVPVINVVILNKVKDLLFNASDGKAVHDLCHEPGCLIRLHCGGIERAFSAYAARSTSRDAPQKIGLQLWPKPLRKVWVEEQVILLYP